MISVIYKSAYHAPLLLKATSWEMNTFSSPTVFLPFQRGNGSFTPFSQKMTCKQNGPDLLKKIEKKWHGAFLLLACASKAIACGEAVRSEKLNLERMLFITYSVQQVEIQSPEIQPPQNLLPLPDKTLVLRRFPLEEQSTNHFIKTVPTVAHFLGGRVVKWICHGLKCSFYHSILKIDMDGINIK